MVDLDKLFDLALISPINVLRELIVAHIEFKVPPNFARDVKATEFIRLYNVEDNQPVSVVHEPILTTLK